ncbi:MAG: ferrous iron transport protein A [Spirochaetes bacterium]|nr:ferrous iron transport protein A [Spirochaetota bacterium]
MMETIRLQDLKVGDEAEILGYAPCDPTYRNKLLSLGLTKATRIRLIQKAPLGDPVEIEVRGFRLSLRKDEANVILLRKLNGEPNSNGKQSRNDETKDAHGEEHGFLNQGPIPHRKRFRWGLRRFLFGQLFL